MEQDGELGTVAGLAAGKLERQGQTPKVGLQMDFGGEAAFESAKRLTRLPPFAPAAETWARTTVLSNIWTRCAVGLCSASIWKKASNTPALLKRQTSSTRCSNCRTPPAAGATYLHGCISTKRHYVRAPDTPAYLDAFLCDDDFQGGLLPRLGGLYVRTISVRAYPTHSSPGLLDRLNELAVSYRWTCRFMPLDKEDARKAVPIVRKRWFARRKGVMALLKEAVTGEPSQLEDPDAAAKSIDAEAALAILGGDYASIGFFTRR